MKQCTPNVHFNNEIAIDVDCVATNSLGDEDVGLWAPMEVPPGWQFSLWRWPHWSVMHDKVNLRKYACHHKQIQDDSLASMCPPQYM